jgi:ATP-dependent DNA helicase DinG
MNLAVPEAVLKLKQGFGRLIRSRSDRGVVLFLDRRMVQKTYGKIFLESLPVESKQVRALPDEKIIEAASDFLNREPAK